MNTSFAGLLISFLGNYFAIAIWLIADRSPARSYLLGLPIALVVTLLGELAMRWVKKRREKRRAEKQKGIGGVV
jgi:Flp pilus assembly protein TadB